LKADRSALEGHERTLVDALFFDGRRETSTEDVRAHYREAGFDPVAAIRPELDARVRVLLEAGDAPRLIGALGVLWFLACAGLLWTAWYRGETGVFLPLFVGIAALVVTGIVRGAGVIFRSRMDWGRPAALLCLLPALWLLRQRRSSSGSTPAGASSICRACVARDRRVGAWVTYNAIRDAIANQPTAVALRKNLTAGRKLFSADCAGRIRHSATSGTMVARARLGEEADDWSNGVCRRMTRSEIRTGLFRYTSSSGTERLSPAVDGAGLAADALEAAVVERRGRLPPRAWRAGLAATIACRTLIIVRPNQRWRWWRVVRRRRWWRLVI
jgi:hypothetical protein